MDELSASERSELACTYAALILHDDNIPITAEKITALLKASNVDFQPFYPNLFARVLANRNLDDLIMGSGGGGAPVAASAPSASSAQESEKSVEKDNKGGSKKEEKVEKEASDEDMGLGLFD
jgi:large subunit ribosomal protein LP1